MPFSKKDSQVDILNNLPFRRRDLREVQDLEVTTPHDGQRRLIIELMSRRTFKENI